MSFKRISMRPTPVTTQAFGDLKQEISKTRLLGGAYNILMNIVFIKM